MSFLLPDGILPRMGLLACGWTNPGDTAKAPTDAAWWSARYRKGIAGSPLWAPLRTYVTAIDSNTPTNWNQALADGDPSELSKSLAMVADDLRVIQSDERYASCAPWLIPVREATMPLPNLTCQSKQNAKKIGPVVDRIKRPDLVGFPWWLWLVVGYVVTRKTNKR